MCGFCAAARLAYHCADNGFGKLEAPAAAQAGTGGIQDPSALSIPNDASTTTTISIGDTIVERLEFEGDADWFAIELNAGDVIQVDLMRADPDPLEDPRLQIFDDQSFLVAHNDDIELGILQESRLFFEAVESGTYYIEAGSFGDADDGDYELSVSLAPADADVLQSSPLYAGLVTDFAMETGRTTASGAMEVRYYFAAANETFSGFGQSITTDISWTAYEQQQIELALDLFEETLNVEFVRVFSQGEADLKFGAGRTGIGGEFSNPGFLGFAFFPGSSALSSLVMLNTGGFGWDRLDSGSSLVQDGLDPGGQGFLTIVHELGHAFGLEHSFEENRSIMFPGLTDEFTLNVLGQPVLPGPDGVADFPFDDGGDFGHNQDVFSVMSYNTGWDDHPRGAVPNTTSGFKESRAGSLMAIDLAVLQDVYGANTSHASGNDTYEIEDVTSAFSKYEAIWDTGGIDEITYDGSASATIDLRPASLRNEEGGGGFISFVDTSRGGYSIARGVEIENAVSGDGIDTLIGNALDNVLDGGGAEDELFGGAGNDTLFGRDDTDNLVGGDGNDFLYGGDAVDALQGGAGDDMLYGGEGNDQFRADAGADAYNGGEGLDTLSFSVFPDFLGPLVLDLVTPSNSQGFAAGDTLESIERIIGAESRQNTLVGDSSDMTLDGGVFEDSIDGGAGKDTIDGRFGNDTLDGGDNDDFVQGGDGEDTVSGGDGNDWLEGGNGADLLYGGDGNDRFNLNSSVEPGPGDIIFGGGGNDTAFADELQDQTFYGGDGIDIISYDLIPIGIFTSLAAPQGFSVTESVEGLAGSLDDDGLTGDDGNNLLIGFDGGDLIYGGAGNDTIDPGPNDTFMFLFTVDVVYGGAGNDTIIAGPDEDTIFGGTGTDFWSFERQNAVDVSLASPGPSTLDSVEGLIGSAGNDTLTGDGADNVLIGRAGDDTLSGGGGDDTADYSASPDAVFVAVDGSLAIGGDAQGDSLSSIEHLTGSAFADLLRGDGGGNVLEGGARGDLLQGGGGDDTLLGGEDNDLLEGGAGNDTLDGGEGLGDFVSALDATGPVVIDLVDPSNSSADYAGDTLISIEGIIGARDFANTITGSDQGFQIAGGSVDDVLTGGAGVDVLIGFAGNDTLVGNGAGDTFFGDEGDDVHTGGAGRDFFLFIDDGQDVIADFNIAEDRLVFTGLGLGFDDLVFSGGAGDAVIFYGADPLNLSTVMFTGVLEADLNPTPGTAPSWILVL